MESKILILRDEDVYMYGIYSKEHIRGGNEKMYKAHLVIRLFNDGSYKILKDRYNSTDRDIQKILNPIQINTNLLLVL